MGLDRALFDVLRVLMLSVFWTENVPFQDRGVLRMGPPNLFNSQNRFMNDPQAHLFDMNSQMSPYQQPQQQQPQQPTQQGYQDGLNSNATNARIRQAMHEHLGGNGGRPASPGLSAANRSASLRQQNFAKMY